MHKVSQTDLWGCLESFSGYTVSGWAWNRLEPAAPPIIDLYISDQLVASVEPTIWRQDVNDAGFGDGLTGFKIVLPPDFNPATNEELRACIRQSGIELQNSPCKNSLPFHIRKWLGRKDRLRSETLARLRRTNNLKVKSRRLSIITPFYNTKADWIDEVISSVKEQWCDAWELICVNDASSHNHVQRMLEQYAMTDPRIKVIHLGINRGIAGAINAGMSIASGDYIAFLDHDDQLEPDAVHKILIASMSEADLIYSDELVCGERLNEILAVAARPAYSYDYYISHPYFVHLVAIKANACARIGGWDENLSISADVDYIIRVLEIANRVAHVPAILYRWRTHERSAGHGNKSKVMSAMLSIIQRHLNRIQSGCVVEAGASFNHFKVNYPDAKEPTLIIIPTKDRVDLLRKCIESIERTVPVNDYVICVIDHESIELETQEYLSSIRSRYYVLPFEGVFNYSKMNNLAVRNFGAKYKYVLFMNNDVQCIHAGWLGRMRSIASRNDVGVVGSTLLFGDGRIQHAGVIVGMQGLADHGHRLQNFITENRRNEGYLSSLVVLRDFSAVTAACMMMRREVFQSVGGFDEDLQIAFNDTDLCLRIGELNLRVLNDGYCVLFHHESVTRKESDGLKHPADSKRFAEKWQRIIDEGDMYYHPLFNTKGQDYEFANKLTSRSIFADARLFENSR